MHNNETFNIVQTGHKRYEWAVIAGKRLPSGAPEQGAKVVQDGLTREQAILLADTLEADLWTPLY
jgi:hypothetical protein